MHWVRRKTMNYEDKSDFEINKSVYALEFREQPKCHGEFIYHPKMCSEYDPCNNPRDSWPIIIENEITLFFGWGDCEVSFNYLSPCGVFGTHETLTHVINVSQAKVLRAAMICYLMKKEKECE